MEQNPLSYSPRLQPQTKEINPQLAATLRFLQNHCYGVPIPYGRIWTEGGKFYAVERPLPPNCRRLADVLPWQSPPNDPAWGDRNLRVIASNLNWIIQQLHAAPAPRAWARNGLGGADATDDSVSLVRAVDGGRLELPPQLSRLFKVWDTTAVCTPLMFHSVLRMCGLEIVPASEESGDRQGSRSSSSTGERVVISSMPGMTMNHRHHLKAWKPWEFPLCFSHGNLTPDNIFVNTRGEVVAITGWEYAGWLPTYWDYAMHRVQDCDEMRVPERTIPFRYAFDTWYSDFWLPYVVPDKHILPLPASTGRLTKADISPVFVEVMCDADYHKATGDTVGFKLAVAQLENVLHSRRHNPGYPIAQYGASIATTCVADEVPLVKGLLADWEVEVVRRGPQPLPDNMHLFV